VISIEQPDQLVAALSALDVGLSLVPADLLERARAVPAISPRQRVVLRAVLAGQSNGAIARVLQVRPVTIKREVSALFAAFDVSRRFELMSAAFALGFQAEAVHP
jgi:DNA-binding NarL/FixJ family response regulator